MTFHPALLKALAKLPSASYHDIFQPHMEKKETYVRPLDIRPPLIITQPWPFFFPTLSPTIETILDSRTPLTLSSTKHAPTAADDIGKRDIERRGRITPEKKFWIAFGLVRGILT